ncbi:MAG: hypothetical protein JWO81_2317 [Alphaproteobacteria bacterium]|nr:hypothetical protein [Alphaproteobacteria bacterium]
MPRYFFHIHDDVVVMDDEGIELPDAEAARREAVAGIREMMCEQLRKGRLALHHRIEVADAAGAPVLSLAFGETVAIEDGTSFLPSGT